MGDVVGVNISSDTVIVLHILSGTAWLVVSMKLSFSI